MKKSTSIMLIVIIVLIVGAMFLVATGLVIYGLTKLDKDTTITTTTRSYGEVFTTNDGQFQLTADPTWEVDEDLNDSADLQIADADNEKYAIVFDEPKTDFADDAILADYYELVSDDFIDTINEVEVGEAEDIIINGYAAKQVEVSGQTEHKVKISYLVTVVETPGHFHQIWTWTTTSNYPTVKADLMDITNSFTETALENINEAY